MQQKELVDYDFCRSAKLNAKDLLKWLELDELLDEGLDELYSWKFFGRNMMIVGDRVRISCIHKDFDRWANSEEFVFDITRPSERRNFVDWVKAQRENQN
jgi:hypothetical protein